ncbi:hypothetical protein NVV94_26425 [Pseudomonas sp. LS1212]|uniref:hypothetical protein n=1 Tax=Pseudomonas sp. LS1212 TaxID=2972478 RepID=UPI00215CCE97|nr:hypothetical protein [Pseudomonas sp. LS1212]UVJ44007.1 hypothetical protein NVV94_26425 [Pseudomonas sp. LS1212]
MKLIHRNQLRPEERPYIYPTAEAVALVKHALNFRQDINGLKGLRRTSMLNYDPEVLKQVQRGEWLLIKRDAKAFDWWPFEAAAAEGRARMAFLDYIKSVPPPKGAAPSGFHIVQRPMSLGTLQLEFFPDPFSEHARDFFQFNPHLKAELKPGQLVIIADPHYPMCRHEHEQLLQAAATVDAALEDLSIEEASFMVKHHDEIGSFLTQGATAVGIGETMFARHLNTMKATLEDLEQLHQRTYQQHGHLQTPEFFAERKRLLSQLDSSLGPLVRKSTGLPDHPKLKSALGISSRSLVHHWDKAGAPGQIPGYATHIDGVSKAARYIRAGGWIGVGLGASASVMKVEETCRVGREDECRQVKFSESGKFGGGLAGGAIGGGAAGIKAAGVLCSGLMKPDTHLGENARQIEVSNDQTTPFLFR